MIIAFRPNLRKKNEIDINQMEVDDLIDFVERHMTEDVFQWIENKALPKSPPKEEIYNTIYQLIHFVCNRDGIDEKDLLTLMHMTCECAPQHISSSQVIHCTKPF
jgi:hypothetical protein